MEDAVALQPWGRSWVRPSMSTADLCASLSSMPSLQAASLTTSVWIHSQRSPRIAWGVYLHQSALHHTAKPNNKPTHSVGSAGDAECVSTGECWADSDLLRRTQNHGREKSRVKSDSKTLLWLTKETHRGDVCPNVVFYHHGHFCPSRLPAIGVPAVLCLLWHVKVHFQSGRNVWKKKCAAFNLILLLSKGMSSL